MISKEDFEKRIFNALNNPKGLDFMKNLLSIRQNFREEMKLNARKIEKVTSNTF
jgi:hypothetical protein